MLLASGVVESVVGACDGTSNRSKLEWTTPDESMEFCYEAREMGRSFVLCCEMNEGRRELEERLFWLGGGV